MKNRLRKYELIFILQIILSTGILISVAAWYGGSTVASTLDNNKIQCATCHDVHDQEAVLGTNLLRAPQTVAQGGTPSQLCYTCHIHKIDVLNKKEGAFLSIFSRYKGLKII